MKKQRIITILMLFSLLVAFKEKSKLSVTHLKCEYKENPLGIDIKIPRLFWEIKSDKRGTEQTAYQILVSSSLEKLKHNNADIWNSGKVVSNQSAHVNYSGKELQSEKKYYWKVKIWDEKGNETTYSESASWEMGILSKKEWKANWIGNNTVAATKKIIENKWNWKEWIWHPTEIRPNISVYFRKKLILPKNKKVTSALMRLTADNKFTAYFNNKELGSGNSWQKIYDFDIANLIKKENIIAIDAANTIGNVCGLLFSIKITFEDGSILNVAPNKEEKGWKTTTEKSMDWKKYGFNDYKWSEVKFMGNYNNSGWGKIDDHQQPYIAPRPVLLRNEISLDKKIKRARAYVTGLGGYVMHINGERVGDAVFTPGWTNYPKRIQYQTFDVGNLLKTGKNAIGAVLGNLWWSSGLGWSGGIAYSKGPLRFFLQLVVDYKDGTSQIFVTDNKWKVHNAPIVNSTLYNGETYDARLEENGWDTINFDASNWKPVVILEKQTGALTAQKGPLLRVVKKIKTQRITSPSKGVYVIDFGQNFAGWAKLKVKGAAGTHVKMRFAETLKPDGNVFRDNLRTAKATDEYILKGKGLEEWQPSFTYHGFRYIEVTGFPGKPNLDSFTGLVVHSDAPNSGEFLCSNKLLNKIQENILWGQGSNMYSVPTDCPQRDERLGWMGDAQAFAPTSCYNMQMINFFNKWMYDITDSQDEDGSVHDVSPVIVVKGPAAPGWGDAVYKVPWEMYKFYGDKRILEENYNAIVAWIEYMRSKSKNDLYEKKGYGDWVAVESSPSKPIGSAYYFYGAKMVSTIAGILGKTEDSQKYKDLSQKIAKAFNKKHFNAETNTYTGNTQSANLIPLNFGIVPKDKRDAVAANIAKNVRDHNMHLTTGFLGIPLLLPTLSNYGYNEMAYTIANQETYPSWGYSISKGATSIWELWNGDTAGSSMNSRNHFALGSVGEWFYAYLGGIKPSEEIPGFKKIIFSPMPTKDLTWAKSKINTTYGMVISNWERKGKTISYNLTIPVNTTAEFHIPFLGMKVKSIIENDSILFRGGNSATAEGIELMKKTENELIYTLESGVYNFSVSYD